MPSIKQLPPPEFISRDVSTITNEIIQMYESLANKKLYPAQADRVFIDVIAYREMLLRSAINETGKQNLVAFASGVMLDYLGQFFGVTRLAGESDDNLRERIRLAPETYSTTGSRRAYIYHAMTADERVIDAEAINVDNRVQVYVLTDTESVPDELIDKVQKAVNDDKHRPLSDYVTTFPAIAHPYELMVELVVQADTNRTELEKQVHSQLDALVHKLRSKLGLFVVPSQIIQAIQHSSIEQIIIKEPSQLISVLPYEYALCTQMNITISEMRSGQ